MKTKAKNKKNNSFNEKCYEVLKKVPKGKVVTYKQIARKLNKKSYRAVGNAMNRNSYNKEIVPCHRVINSNGQVGGYNSGQKKKISILRSEGVEIVNGKVDLNKYSCRL